MNWDRIRLWFNVTVAIGLLLTAAFCASTDFRVRLDGWLAVVCSLCAISDWYECESKKGRV